MMNYFNLIFSKNSILRSLQLAYFKKIEFKGLCLEFGANKDINRNFLKPYTKSYKTIFSNIEKKNKNFLYLDLQKKKIHHKTKYDNIVIYNVLEHIYDIDISLKNINYLLKKNGRVYGSTPFIYRIHEAPDDYSRYSKSFLELKLKNNKFNDINIREIGLGPFLASFSLLRGYIKFIPIIYNIILFMIILLDKFLICFMRNDPKIIFPIGYVFSAKKK